MESEPTDAEVISGAGADPHQFALIFERHYRSTYAYLRRRVGRSAADDLTAATFEVAFRSRDRYRAFGGSALPWLLGIATNLVRRKQRDEARQLRAYARSGPREIEQSEHLAVDERLDAARFLPRLAKALQDLPPNQRDVLLLHAWADLSYEEIAESLNIPVGTVRSSLSRARRRLRQEIEALEAPHPRMTKEVVNDCR